MPSAGSKVVGAVSWNDRNIHSYRYVPRTAFAAVILHNILEENYTPLPRGVELDETCLEQPTAMTCRSAEDSRTAVAIRDMIKEASGEWTVRPFQHKRFSHVSKMSFTPVTLMLGSKDTFQAVTYNSSPSSITRLTISIVVTEPVDQRKILTDKVGSVVMWQFLSIGAPRELPSRAALGRKVR